MKSARFPGRSHRTSAPRWCMLAALVLASCALGGIPVTVQAHEMPAVRLANAHEEALKSIFVEARTMSIARTMFLANAPHAYHGKLLEHFARVHPDEQVAASYARQVAASVTPADSAASLRIVRMPQMRAMMQQFEALASQNPASTKTSPAIKKLGAQIETLAAPAHTRALGRLTPVSNGIGAFYLGLVRAHDKALGQQFSAILIGMLRISVNDNFSAADITRERVGFEPVDKILDIYAHSLERIAALAERTTAANTKIGLDTLLEPAYLVDRAGIARGRKMLAESGQVSQDHLAGFQEIFGTRRDQVRTALQAMPSYSAQELDANASRVMEFLLEVTETRQRQHAVVGRMLDFAESRIGQTSLGDGKLLFRHDADLAIWMTMVSELERLEAQDVQVIAGQVDKERKAMDQFEKRP